MISVCMAVFNGEHYILNQISSILGQLSDEDEVIIISDCSRDGSVRLIQNIADPRITLYQNEVNIGPAATFERAISRAKGQYIFLSDQDDIWRRDKVNFTLQVLESTGALAVVSDAQIVDTNLNAIAGTSLFSLRSSGPGFWRNLYRNGFVGCCMAFRSDIRSFLFPFPANAVMHDEWIGLCSSIAGRVIFCDRKLIDHRRHEENASSLFHGSVTSMMRKRWNLMLSITGRLPKIIKWRSTR